MTAKMGMGEPLCFLSRSYLEKGTEGYVNVEGDHIYVYSNGNEKIPDKNALQIIK